VTVGRLCLLILTFCITNIVDQFLFFSKITRRIVATHLSLNVPEKCFVIGRKLFRGLEKEPEFIHLLLVEQRYRNSVAN